MYVFRRLQPRILELTSRRADPAQPSDDVLARVSIVSLELGRFGAGTALRMRSTGRWGSGARRFDFDGGRRDRERDRGHCRRRRQVLLFDVAGRGWSLTRRRAAVDSETSSNRKAKVLKTQADCDRHTIHDIVLPLAGYNILYPENELAHVYKEMMSVDGLDWSDLRRSRACVCLIPSRQYLHS